MAADTASRVLRRRRWSFRGRFALSCALGLWVAMFAVSLVRYYVYRDPPGIRNTTALRRIFVARTQSTGFRMAPVLSYVELAAMRALAAPDVEGYVPLEAQLWIGDSRRDAAVVAATPGFLKLLGARPVVGVIPDTIDYRDEPAPPAMISFALWKAAFGGSATVVGRTVRLNRITVRIAGVLERSFTGIDRDQIDVVLGIRPDVAAAIGAPMSANEFHLSAVTRVTPANPSRSLVSRLFQTLADVPGTGRDIQSVSLAPIRVSRLDDSSGAAAVARYILILAGAVVVLAGANCVFLILDRLHDRLADMRVRWTLGAPRHAMVRAVATDPSVAALAALLVVLAGFGPSALAMSHLGLALPDGLRDTVTNVTAVLLTILIAVTAILLATVETLRQSDSRALPGGPLAQRAQKTLVGAYVAGICALSVAVAPVIAQYAATVSANPGFDARRTLVVTATFHERRPSVSSIRLVLDHLAAMPEVGVAAASGAVPYRSASVGSVPTRSARDAGPPVYRMFGVGNVIAALGIPVRLGQVDQAGAAADGIIVNEEMARRSWPGAALGQCVYVYGDRCERVVAITGNTDAMALGDAPQPMIFARMLDALVPRSVAFLVRTRSSPETRTLQAAQQEVGTAFPTAVVKAERFQDIAAEQRRTLGRFAGGSVALLLVASLQVWIGLSAIMRTAMHRRAKELAIRAAIGASPLRLLLTLSSEFAITVFVAALVGVWLGFASQMVVAGYVTGISATAVARQLAVGLVVPAAIVCASLLPAWRLSDTRPALLLSDPSA